MVSLLDEQRRTVNRRERAKGLEALRLGPIWTSTAQKLATRAA
jgi:hypothetical protein